jgi:hypothetical protein
MATIASIKDQIGNVKHMIDINQENYEASERQSEISYYLAEGDILERRMKKLESLLKEAEAELEVIA